MYAPQPVSIKTGAHQIMAYEAKEDNILKSGHTGFG